MALNLPLFHFGPLAKLESLRNLKISPFTLAKATSRTACGNGSANAAIVYFIVAAPCHMFLLTLRSYDAQKALHERHRVYIRLRAHLPIVQKMYIFVGGLIRAVSRGKAELILPSLLCAPMKTFY